MKFLHLFVYFYIHINEVFTLICIKQVVRIIHILQRSKLLSYANYKLCLRSTRQWMLSPVFSLVLCITNFTTEEEIYLPSAQYYWSWNLIKTMFYYNNFRSTRLATFPDYLVVQLKKFTIGDDWVPKKLGMSIWII